MNSVKTENTFPAFNDRKAFYKMLCKLVLPIVFQYFMSALVSASDAFMLGFLDQASLSAVSLAGQVAFVYYLFINTFLTGAMVLGAQYWGKKEYTTLEDVLGVTMRYVMLIGMTFTLAAVFCPSLLMRVFTRDPELIEGGVRYLRMVAVGYFIMGFVDSYLCFMKICEKTMMNMMNYSKLLS